MKLTHSIDIQNDSCTGSQYHGEHKLESEDRALHQMPRKACLLRYASTAGVLDTPNLSRPVQIFGALVGVATQILVKEILFTKVPDICEPDQASSLTCPNTSIMYSASIMW